MWPRKNTAFFYRSAYLYYGFGQHFQNFRERGELELQDAGSNGFNRPVLKHGPRSLTDMRVCGWQTCTRNESDHVGILLYMVHLWPTTILERGLSMSISVRTRKMVNYAWVEWSQVKTWWRFVAILTCKSFVKLGYRGERLIEPSSSWFLPKFPSG